MSRREINRIKNKVRLWCVLHGVKMGSREVEYTNLVYSEACDVCKSKNGGSCIGYQKAKENKPLLALDAERMVLYQNVGATIINDRSRECKGLWCVEWVNHV